MQNDLQTTSWDNSNIFKNFSDPLIETNLKLAEKNISFIQNKTTMFEDLVTSLHTKSLAELQETTLSLARELYRLKSDTQLVLFTATVYGSTASSVNSLNYDAKNLTTKARQLMANLAKASKPLDLFLLRVPTAYLTEFLNDNRVRENTFQLKYAKTQDMFLLSVPEEVLLEGHAVDGHHAWDRLYTELSGSMKFDVAGVTMGLAQASNILFGSDRPAREIAYKAINKAWMQNEIAAGAVVNALSGWRLENNRARSKKQELHYLDKSCFEQKISRSTLNTMMDLTFEKRELGQEALKLMAREMSLEKIAPWDILAPYPSKSETKAISFPEGMKIIIEAFGKFDPDMADFAKMMWDKNWIDAKPSENRAAGAYCTRFANTSEPRVFITYEGNMKNVITLAHELGHAYHTWIMRDQKLGETFYPMTLAETASIFAENLVRDAILEKATTAEEKKAILWQEVESAATLMINIPARFEFEKQMLELRKTKSLTVPELKDMTVKAWQLWYGSTLTEYNEMFWASKLHFSKSSVSFYNYPYLFGYLFSLGIYAKKDQYGTEFKALYKNILRDTGIMTAEDLIMKYFKEDISKKDFWIKSFNIVEAAITKFKAL